MNGMPRAQGCAGLCPNRMVFQRAVTAPTMSSNISSAATIDITEKIAAMGLTQIEAAKLLSISQPRVSALLQGKIGKFRLDGLVDMAHRLGLNVSIRIAA